MAVEMVLNDLSLQGLAPNKYAARERMSGLIATMITAGKAGVQRILRTDTDFNSKNLAPAYSVAQWRNDPEVDREQRRFIGTLATKAPYWTYLAESIKDDFDLSEGKHDGESAAALCFAYISGHLAVSLLSDTKWGHAHINLHFIAIDSDSADLKPAEFVMIPHASRSIHIQAHHAWIKETLRSSAHNGVQLWEQRQTLFQNLEFCDNVRENLETLNSGHPMLNPVMKRLFELQDYCRSWTSGYFDFKQLPCKTSPESDARLSQHENLFVFKCPDGQKRIFSWHVRMAPDPWRLHFFPDLGPGKIIIGYIGRKIGI